MAEHIIQKNYQNTTEDYARLLAEGTRNITKSAENWVHFLQFSGQNFTQHPDNIIVLHEAFPEGITFDTYEGYQRLGRQVARGEKSIALIARNEDYSIKRNNNSNFIYDRVFAVSQTIPQTKDDPILSERLWHLKTQRDQLEAARNITSACVDFGEIEAKKYNFTDYSTRLFIERSAFVICAQKTGFWGNESVQDQIDNLSVFFDENNSNKIDFSKAFNERQNILNAIITVARNTINKIGRQRDIDGQLEYTKEKGAIVYDKETGRNYLRQPSGGERGDRERNNIRYSGRAGNYREVRFNEERMAHGAEDERRGKGSDNDRTPEQGARNVQRNSSNRSEPDLAAADEGRQSERTEAQRGLLGSRGLDGETQSDSGRNSSARNDIHEVENRATNSNTTPLNVAYRSVYQALSDDHRNVKDWYATAFSEDGLVALFNDNTTFSQVWNALCNGDNIYDTIGVDDSVVRERIFTEMANSVAVNYEAIYDMYLFDNQQDRDHQIETLKQIQAAQQPETVIQTTLQETQQPTEEHIELENTDTALTPDEKQRGDELAAQAMKVLEMYEKEGELVYGIDTDGQIIRGSDIVREQQVAQQPEKIKVRNKTIKQDNSGYEQLSLFDLVDEDENQATVSSEKPQSYYAVSGVSMGMVGGGQSSMFISNGENAEAEARIDVLPNSAIGFNKKTFNEEFYFDDKADAEKFASLVRKYHNNTDFAKAWTTARNSSINLGDSEKLFNIFSQFVDIEQENITATNTITAKASDGQTVVIAETRNIDLSEEQQPQLSEAAMTSIRAEYGNEKDKLEKFQQDMHIGTQLPHQHLMEIFAHDERGYYSPNDAQKIKDIIDNEIKDISVFTWRDTKAKLIKSVSKAIMDNVKTAWEKYYIAEDKYEKLRHEGNDPDAVKPVYPLFYEHGTGELLYDYEGTVTLIQTKHLASAIIGEEIELYNAQHPSIQQPTETIETAAQQPAAQQTQELINFKVTQQEYSSFPEKERFHNNVEAIQLLKRIEGENRLATAHEQEILSRYVGWGGLSSAFDNRKEEWSKEYNELKELLTDAEYSAARQSTVTAFYTPQTVTEAIYDALDNFGFEKGNILEPAAGTGNFFGALPDKMSQSRLYGVEMDSISGRIAKQLYQKADIKISPYQEAEYPDNFFDVSISNVPFAQIKPYDSRYNRLNMFVHDYYFAKTLDKVRPGGVIAFVTSTGTMDKQDTEVRKYIAQRAEFLGAVRLPNTTFKGIANTSASSDIIFLQKRDYIEAEPNADWIYLSTTVQEGQAYNINSYFVEHPEMILGRLGISHMYGGEHIVCEAIPGANLKEQLQGAIQNIKGEIIRNAAAEFEASEEAKEEGIDENSGIPAESTVKDNSLTIFEDKLYLRKGSMMYEAKSLSPTIHKRKFAYAQVTKAMNALIDYESADAPDIQIETARKELNRFYNEFTKQYGLINSKRNSQLFKEDNNYSLVTSIEELDEDGKLKNLAPIMEKRTISPYIVPSRASTSIEALTISLQQKGTVDLEYICGLVQKEQDEVLTELKGLVYKDYEQTSTFNHDVYVLAEEYLSGQVKDKLRWLENSENIEKIRNANNGELPKDYTDNIRAMREVQPKRLEAKDISVSLGANWVPAQYYVDFACELLDFKPGTWYHDQLTIETVTKTVIDKIDGTPKDVEEWEINFANRHMYVSNNLLKNVYGVAGVDNAHALRLIEDCMNSKSTQLKIKDEPKKSLEKTLEAQVKQRKIETKFREWIFKDEKRRNALVDLYNEKFNSSVARKYDGSHLNFPGMSIEWTKAFRDFQKDAVARVLYGGNTLLAHCVGAGKTFEMVAAAMESKRLGHCNKPMIVVPNHLVVQTAAEFMRLYPGASIIVPNSSKDLTKKNRRKFVARIATNNCDAVIVPQSFFNKMKMSADYCRKFTIDEIEKLREEKSKIEGRGGNVKNVEAAIDRMKQYIIKLEDGAKRDINIDFDKLGVDMLFIDEAHEYKNLLFTSNIKAKGLGNQNGSGKAWDMNMKVQFINEKTNYKGVVFATGTPVSNSLAELWTMQRYLRPDRLHKLGHESFDRWAKTFASVESNMELDVTGSGLRTADRLSKFFNMPELMNIVWEFADIKTTDQLKLPVPEVTFEDIIVQPTPTQERMISDLNKRCAYVREHPRDPEVIAEGGMLGVTNRGRKIAIDQRYYVPETPDDPDSKLDTVAKRVAKIYKDTEKDKLTQVIFCDMATPHPKGQNNLLSDGEFCAYDDIKAKLISYGVKPEEIAFIHDAEKKSDPARAKQDLFNKMQHSEIRVLLGSTQKLGVGSNFQKKLIALHNVDCPWRPLDFTQRIGRIVRQGNENDHVYVYNYGVERTFDAYMYNIVAAKQKFAGQIMTGQVKDRECDDLGDQQMDYSQMSACLSGDPRILQQANLQKQVKELEDERTYFYNDIYDAQDKLNTYPQKKIIHENRIREWVSVADVAKAATAADYEQTQEKIKTLADEIAKAKTTNISEEELKTLREKRAELKKLENSAFGSMYFENKGVEVHDRTRANEFLYQEIEKLDHNAFDKEIKPVHIGKYRNLDLDIYYHFANNSPMAALSVNGGTPYEIKISGMDGADNFRRIDNELGKIDAAIKIEQYDLHQINENIERCKGIVNQTFEKQEELDRKSEELIRLNQELDVSKNKSVIETEITTKQEKNTGVRVGQPHNDIAINKVEPETQQKSHHRHF